eukprot:366503-Chlamydomonas_euryale.AAC.9
MTAGTCTAGLRLAPASAARICGVCGVHDESLHGASAPQPHGGAVCELLLLARRRDDKVRHRRWQRRLLSTVRARPRARAVAAGRLRSPAAHARCLYWLQETQKAALPDSPRLRVGFSDGDLPAACCLACALAVKGPYSVRSKSSSAAAERRTPGALRAAGRSAPNATQLQRKACVARGGGCDDEHRVVGPAWSALAKLELTEGAVMSVQAGGRQPFRCGAAARSVRHSHRVLLRGAAEAPPRPPRRSLVRFSASQAQQPGRMESLLRCAGAQAGRGHSTTSGAKSGKEGYRYQRRHPSYEAYLGRQSAIDLEAKVVPTMWHTAKLPMSITVLQLMRAEQLFSLGLHYVCCTGASMSESTFITGYPLECRTT